jgi:membrane protein DedA with SNARE-associated domain
MNNIASLFEHYGYFVLLIGLFLEYAAVPFPGELALSYCGYLVYQGKLNFFVGVLTATIGTIMGITLSYFWGFYLGYPFLQKYGRYLHLKQNRLEGYGRWFDKYGRKIIFIAYFFPGIRHITGYFSGITRVSRKRFMLNAYFGALVWTFTFIFAGEGLGSRWSKLHVSLRNLGIYSGIILCMFVIGIYIVRYYKNRLLDMAYTMLNRMAGIVNSLRKLEIAITISLLAFLGLVGFMIEMLEDFLSHENTQLDVIMNYYLSRVYSRDFGVISKFLIRFTSQNFIVLLLIICMLVIISKGKHKLLEFYILLVVSAGGEFLARFLDVFLDKYKLGGTAAAMKPLNSYPKLEAMVSIVCYGYMFYIIYKHVKNKLVKSMLTILLCGMLFSSGLALIYLQLSRASGVLAGYVFGGVWLGLNIILLELYRMLPTLFVGKVYKKHNK